jgi:hypothetical protein
MKPRLHFVRRLADFAGVDAAAFYGMSARIWSVLSGPVTVVLIALYFTAEIQGYYYLFASLIGLQVFFELGLNQVLIQFASHEWAKLRLDGAGRIAGVKTAASRLAGLARFAAKWFAVAAALYFCGLEAAGWFMLHAAPGEIAWRAPWTSLCLAAAVDLGLMPLWSMLEGCHQLSSLYFIRFVRAVANSLAVWAAIRLDAGLWALSAGLWAGLLVMTGLAAWRHAAFFSSLWRIPVNRVVHWRTELWPMQWRIALSWLGGYFYFLLFTPVLFKYHGAVEAGQMGMTLNILIALSGIAGILVQTKAPHFGRLIAGRNWRELDRLALRAGLGSVLLMIAGGVVLFAVVLAFNALHSALALRVLPPETFGIFLAATLAIQSTVPLAFYLRAHKREPYLAVSVISGLLVGAGTLLLGRPWGAMGMALGYAAVTFAVSVPMAIIVFLRCRRAWHAEETAPALASGGLEAAIGDSLYEPPLH